MEHKSYQEKEVYDQVQDTIDAIRENLGIGAIIVPFIFYQRETPWPYGTGPSAGCGRAGNAGLRHTRNC